MLPNFLIIGAAKSATTWVMESLNCHPDIFVYQEEIFYFNQYFDNGIEWYEQFFKDVEQETAVGENSNGYLTHSASGKRIKKLIPDVKLLAILRNPVDRAYSAYCMHYSQGRASKEIKLYLDPERIKKEKAIDVLSAGFYGKQIQRYYDLFDHEQIKVVIYDDLKKNSDLVLTQLYKFLGVREDLDIKLVGKTANVRKKEYYSPAVKKMLVALKNKKWINNRITRISANPIIRSLKSKLPTSEIKYPVFEEELKCKLLNYYLKDIEKLEKLINRNLESWKIG